MDLSSYVLFVEKLVGPIAAAKAIINPGNYASVGSYKNIWFRFGVSKSSEGAMTDEDKTVMNLKFSQMEVMVNRFSALNDATSEEKYRQLCEFVARENKDSL